ncbi:hypothetical protein JCM1393_09320 [Clostridium carnis]
MKTNYLYNNIYETSIKILVLVNCFERELELQELIYYDYLSVHLGDIDSNEVVLRQYLGHKKSNFFMLHF